MKKILAILFYSFFLTVGFTAEIHEAVFEGDSQKILDLINSGVDINAPREFDGYTPLHVAAYMGKTELVALLVDSGADVHAKNKSGETPLHWSAHIGDTESVLILVDNGADVNAKENRFHRTPMHETVYYISKNKGTNGNAKRLEVLNILIKKGANVNIRDKNGWAPLHQTSNLEAAKLLIDNGADVNIKNNYGITPLHIREHFKNTEMVEFLKRNGAKKKRSLFDLFSFFNEPVA